jgi:hypothetical protein
LTISLDSYLRDVSLEAIDSSALGRWTSCQFRAVKA